MTITALLTALLLATAMLIGCVVAADALSGLVHWAEDCYGSPDWAIIGATVIAPNLLHHREPRAFLKHGWWKANDMQFLSACAVCVGAWACGVLSWQLIVIAALIANANTIHQWAHRSPSENGRVVTALQRLHLIQGRAHHGRHHGGRRDSHYCAITPWLNPLLDRCGVWRMLERLIAALTTVTPRIDPDVARRSAA